jgi:hypothetical protein
VRARGDLEAVVLGELGIGQVAIGLGQRGLYSSSQTSETRLKNSSGKMNCL